MTLGFQIYTNCTVQCVCLYNIECEHTVIHKDKGACSASKLCYLALAKIPFSLNNVRSECEKDA